MKILMQIVVTLGILWSFLLTLAEIPPRATVMDEIRREEARVAALEAELRQIIDETTARHSQPITEAKERVRRLWASIPHEHAWENFTPACGWASEQHQRCAKCGEERTVPFQSPGGQFYFKNNQLIIPEGSPLLYGQ